ncbi:nuclear fusion protein KAR5 [Diplogelasinospora grovesii]|uniref:Nuclear fusion protein KAR5 n=1 Tax=Diplogelasinospora grovesii TaxID=303347 RepID=A0AAN6S3W5_9PEZI|nr:nuclear fusion protein KAR5 [Diplogelasinospora grovesii]
MPRRNFAVVVSNIRLALLLWTILLGTVHPLSWGSDRKVADRIPSELLQQPSRLPNIYAVALSELQELESEPLCHRVAARLLVNNCQLVDGKDDATILTDSGRQVRDFVDSYAASLAICDLERGSFAIPKECSKFREPSLSQIAIRDEPQLHVSSKEIGLCLSALAASDAAWTTWISYRHKALRFCEAARADNEKAQNILLYQRLTQVIAKLVDGVEVELQRRMDEIDVRARQSAESLAQLTPHIDQLRDGLERVEGYITKDLEATIRRSTDSIGSGLQHAENLQQLLSLLFKNVLESNSQLAHAHDQSLQQVSTRANDDLAAFMEVVATAAASSVSLQKQIEVSNRQAAELAHRQDTLEQGMGRLITVTETLSTTYKDHTHMLKQANNITNDILDALEETAATASSVNQSLFKDAASTSWWPYIVCPTVSLVMGSYGLPPSAFRNLGLLALGEAVGLLFASFDQLTNSLSFSTPEAIANTTVSSL